MLQDMTFPWILCYFNGQCFSRMVHACLGEAQIEDLWINYFCVTTNISKGEMNVHKTGCLWKAVRASMSIVELVPPMNFCDETAMGEGAEVMRRHGRQPYKVLRGLHVDGGYTNNMPIDIMHDQYGVAMVVARALWQW